jgi:hypothetical protein
MFPLYAAALSFAVWVLRGRTWPVRCLYPWTQEEWPCENWVAGEWYRCHAHQKVRYYKHHSGHWVDPKIQRWQIGDYKSGKLVDRPIEGVGFIRIRPAAHALLYRNGYARRPSDVILAIPQYFRDSWQRLGSIRLRKDVVPPADQLVLGRQGVRDATAEHLHVVVGATQLTFVTFAFSLFVTSLQCSFLRRNSQ